ncbi:MAG: transglutaminase-like cysteine peptidase [Cypionkella sp.]
MPAAGGFRLEGEAPGESRLAQVRRAQERGPAVPPAPGASLAPGTAGLAAGAGCRSASSLAGITPGARDAGRSAPPERAPLVLAEPAATAGAPAAGVRPDFFGSAAIEVARTPLEARFSAAREGLGHPGKGPWIGIVRSARRQPLASAVERVNRWVNQWVRYREDGSSPSAPGMRDSWSTPGETLARRRGDCEDVAIAKMALLRRLGVPEADMYLVIAYDQVVRRDHALLVVRQGTRYLALDNRTDVPLDALAGHGFRPIMSFSGRRSWLHGVAEKNPAEHRLSALGMLPTGP